MGKQLNLMSYIFIGTNVRCTDSFSNAASASWFFDKWLDLQQMPKSTAGSIKS